MEMLLVSRNVVQLIVDELHDIFSIDLEEAIFKRFKKLLPPNIYDQVVNLVKPLDLLLFNSLQSFESDFRRLCYYTKIGTLVLSIEVIIAKGCRENERISDFQ